MALLTKGKLFGDVQCYMYSVEWQKRGLPHVLILLWLQNRISSNIIDNVISAEIPDPEQDPLLYDIVKSNMIHGPCGSLNPNAPCMKENTCSKRYPRKLCLQTQTGDNGYPEYKRRSTNNGGFTVRIKGLDLDNHWVVPYNPVLLRTFNCHINVEMCHSVKCIKYICKYVNKGSDQAAFTIENQKDEITMYESGRYINSAEAVWRILSLSIERYPTVFHLAVHLENGQRVYFTPNNLAEKLNNPTKTTLLAFFELCKTDVFAKTLLYSEVPSYFVFKNNKFQRRKQGRNVDDWPTVKKDDALGRVYTIHPHNTECYYLRMLLHEIRGPTSFSDLKTVNGILHNTFLSACNVLGLLEDDNHWNNTLNEAFLSDSPSKLRELFTVMLVFCQLSDPLTLWDTHKNNLSEDIIRQMDADQEDEAHNKCLIQIEDAVLTVGGQSISNYGLPQPTRTENNFKNIIYQREINYDLNTLTKVVLSNEALLTNEQYNVYSRIMHSIKYDTGNIFFLSAPAGTGKTFLINLLLTKVRSNRNIALAVASSGIAATLLQGGRTAHSAFKLPIDLINIETPMCNIPKQSNITKVLRDCKFIVWDESTMAHKRCFEALDRSLKDIRNKNEVMGGATVLLTGDFRQTLPVIPRGSRADEVKACIKASYLWPLIEQLSLKKNMRVRLGGDVTAGKFSELLLKIGNGDFPELDGKLVITKDLGLVVTPLQELIVQIYPDIADIKNKSMDWLCERAILTPKNDRAAVINEIILKSLKGTEMEYKSIDMVLKTDDAVHYPVEFLNALNPPGFPAHELVLKVGAQIMLLRNLHPPKLCNGTRLYTYCRSTQT
ncbi:uncharacterized protein LOC114130689 [Aphis gossypii]|uniref:uncharacterized protein LOC114130689 n=1 Tax=Aphis gossypii TaxID=80765 RepID=UPI002159B180|nr:uncharacterized protein LOC114130689 [Aphis gossypii]